ncbi:hypothetical protein DL98DRAFT_441252, partial [Cadophora sp. DSE1049]
VFLGFTNFYYRFILGYSKITTGLIGAFQGIKNKIKKGPFKFFNKARESFINLKATFISILIIIHFNLTKFI